MTSLRTGPGLLAGLVALLVAADPSLAGEGAWEAMDRRALVRPQGSRS
jgi:hypothetical protein